MNNVEMVYEIAKEGFKVADTVDIISEPWKETNWTASRLAYFISSNETMYEYVKEQFMRTARLNGINVEDANDLYLTHVRLTDDTIITYSRKIQYTDMFVENKFMGKINDELYDVSLYIPMSELFLYVPTKLIHAAKSRKFSYYIPAKISSIVKSGRNPETIYTYHMFQDMVPYATQICVNYDISQIEYQEKLDMANHEYLKSISGDICTEKEE